MDTTIPFSEELPMPEHFHTLLDTFVVVDACASFLLARHFGAGIRSILAAVCGSRPGFTEADLCLLVAVCPDVLTLRGAAAPAAKVTDGADVGRSSAAHYSRLPVRHAATPYFPDVALDRGDNVTISPVKQNPGGDREGDAELHLMPAGLTKKISAFRKSLFHQSLLRRIYTVHAVFLAGNDGADKPRRGKKLKRKAAPAFDAHNSSSWSEGFDLASVPAVRTTHRRVNDILAATAAAAEALPSSASLSLGALTAVSASMTTSSSSYSFSSLTSAVSGTISNVSAVPTSMLSFSASSASASVISSSASMASQPPGTRLRTPAEGDDDDGDNEWIFQSDRLAGDEAAAADTAAAALSHEESADSSIDVSAGATQSGVAALDSVETYLRSLPAYVGQIVHSELRVGKVPRYSEIQRRSAVPSAVWATLQRRGITRLFSHQAAAIDAALSGRHVIISTATSSGKSVAFHVPVFTALLTDPAAVALYIFPTKALAQDQLRALREFTQSSPELQAGIRPATLDGDTPFSARDAIREGSNLILCNPDILHATVLPGHSSWRRVLANLRYVVVDEAHVYTGVFGTHVALVFRRLARLCAHYGSAVQFIAASATISNPIQHFSALVPLDAIAAASQSISSSSSSTSLNTGVGSVVSLPPFLVDGSADGSAVGARRFILWNPPVVGTTAAVTTESGEEEDDYSGGTASNGGLRFDNNNDNDNNNDVDASNPPAAAAAAASRLNSSQSKKKRLRIPAEQSSSSSSSGGSNTAGELANGSSAALSTITMINDAAASLEFSDSAFSDSIPLVRDPSVLLHNPCVLEAFKMNEKASQRTGARGPISSSAPVSLSASTSLSANRNGNATVAPVSGSMGVSSSTVVCAPTVSPSTSTSLGAPLVTPVRWRDVVAAANSRNSASGAHQKAAVQVPRWVERLTSTPSSITDSAPASSASGDDDESSGSAPLRRRSNIVEAADLLASFVRGGWKTIAFVRVRKVAELMLQYTQESLLKPTAGTSASTSSSSSSSASVSNFFLSRGVSTSSSAGAGALLAASPTSTSGALLAASVKSYRAGYLKEHRRDIEAALSSGALRGVIATNALELGVDIGCLDAVLLVGWPGSSSSFWQQVGRAGRGGKPSIAIMSAWNSAIDQSFCASPHSWLAATPEAANVDPENSIVLRSHAMCAARELPLRVSDMAWFGRGLGDVVAQLRMENLLISASSGMQPLETQRCVAPDGRDLGDLLVFVPPRWIDRPTMRVSLRRMDETVYSVLSDAGVLLDEVEEHRAWFELYEGGIYMNQGRTFQVHKLDIQGHVAHVRPASVRYYTSLVDTTDVNAVSRSASSMRDLVHRGRVNVVFTATGYQKVRRYSGIPFQFTPLNLPALHLETEGFWVDVPLSVLLELTSRGLDYQGGLHAAGHAVLAVLPLFVKCERCDVGTECASPFSTHARPLRLIIYDRNPGGVGIARAAFEAAGGVLRAALALMEQCQCSHGCMKCIHDGKCAEYNVVLDKAAAIVVLREALRT